MDRFEVRKPMQECYSSHTEILDAIDSLVWATEHIDPTHELVIVGNLGVSVARLKLVDS